MKKALFLAYFYPPIGGAGVQRTVKFIKYLPDYGFCPVVVAGTGKDIALPFDNELSKEVAHIKRYDIQFTRIENKLDNFIEGSFGRWTRLSMSSWLKAAQRTIEMAIEREKPDILYVTTSPFPAAKIIAQASKKYDIPWVLDMRDPWALDPIMQYPTRLHYQLDLRDMETACQAANAVIMNTPGALRAVMDAFPKVPTDKFYCITNGWDKADFGVRPKTERLPGSPMKVVHTGVFHAMSAERNSRWHPLRSLRYSASSINLLTRSPYYLFAAYRELVESNKITPNAIRFIFAGAVTSEDRQLAEKYDVANITEFRGYLNHQQSIELLNEADVLFLPLHLLEGQRDPLIVPGKTYEYLAAQKPILACVPGGDTRNFVLNSGLGYVCDPSDVKQICDTLFDLHEQRIAPGGIKVFPNAAFIESFCRQKLTGRLAEVFTSVLR